MTPLVWQSPFTGQVWGPCLQLQGGVVSWAVVLRILVLWLLITWLMLGIHLYPTFTVFLFMILAKGCCGGKQESISFRNFAPTLVETFCENGGLNHVLFLDLFLFFLFWLDGCWYFSSCSNPLLVKDSWKGAFAALKTSSFCDMLLSLLFTASGILFIIEGGGCFVGWYTEVNYGVSYRLENPRI